MAYLVGVSLHFMAVWKLIIERAKEKERKVMNRFEVMHAQHKYDTFVMAIGMADG